LLSSRFHFLGGQFVTHVAALPGNPYDGHTLATVIPAMEGMIGCIGADLAPEPEDLRFAARVGISWSSPKALACRS